VGEPTVGDPTPCDAAAGSVGCLDPPKAVTTSSDSCRGSVGTSRRRRRLTCILVAQRRRSRRADRRRHLDVQISFLAEQENGGSIGHAAARERIRAEIDPTGSALQEKTGDAPKQIVEDPDSRRTQSAIRRMRRVFRVAAALARASQRRPSRGVNPRRREEVTVMARKQGQQKKGRQQQQRQTKNQES
jgi:hypothetical protein